MWLYTSYAVQPHRSVASKNGPVDENQWLAARLAEHRGERGLWRLQRGVLHRG
jgi:hypothetical protein